MRRYLLILIFSLVGIAASAQTTTVTGNGIVDPNGNLYNVNATVSAFLVTPTGVIPRVNGVPLNPALGPFPIDNTGSFSIQVTPNVSILPGGTQWVFTICGTSVNLGPQPKPLLQVCFNTALITVTSPGPQDITAQANAAAVILGPKAGSGVGGGCVGPGTVNTVSKFTTSNCVGNSSVTDDGIVATREPNGNNTAISGVHDEWGVDAGGTIANRLVCVTSNRLVQTCPLGATSGIAGVADKTVAAGGTVPVCWGAKCNITAATPTVTNDWLVASVTVAGEADDVGAAKPSNTQTFPADSTVTAGQLVLSTLLSMDTINAQVSGSGTINPCGPGVAYYPGPGVNTIINCIPNPSAPAAVPQLFSATPGSTPGWNLPGVPVNSQIGTNYTILTTDRLKLVTGSNANPTSWTGPALISNFAFALWNLNSGAITFTPASGLVNGSATQLIPPNVFGFHYTDNTNTFMPLMPTLAAFPNCIDSGGNHLNFTSSTGVLSCGTTSPVTSNGTINISDPAPVAGDDLLFTVANPSVLIHLTRISCGVQGATSVVINLVSGGNSLIADMTCTAGNPNTVIVTTWANGSGQCGGTSSCAIAVHAPVMLHIGAIVGTPTALNVSVDYN